MPDQPDLPDKTNYAIALITLSEEGEPTVVDTFQFSPWLEACVLQLALNAVDRQLTYRKERVASLQEVKVPPSIITLAQELVNKTQAHIDVLLPAIEATQRNCSLWDAILNAPGDYLPDCDEEEDKDDV